MEIIIPGGSSMDFEFNGKKSSPRFTVPSMPTLAGEHYFSAPASPSRISQFYREFDEFLINNSRDEEARRNSVSSAVPFDWEEKPGIPKSSAKVKTMNEDDFAFDLSQEMEAASRPADELFDGGKIRPIKPPPRLQFPNHTTNNSTVASSPISEHKRGRERSVSSLSSSRSGHRETRSLSPLRVSEYPWEEEYQQQQQNRNLKQSSTSSKPTLTSTSSTLASSSSMKGNKKWKLKDFFLFRSASEGRATDKDPLKKYASFFKKNEDLKSSSLRSIDSPGTSVSSSRRRGQISAHELHYTTNRAVSEDLKKKTFLPYKQGILGRLAFNPAVHAIANGFGFSHK